MNLPFSPTLVFMNTLPQTCFLLRVCFRNSRFCTFLELFRYQKSLYASQNSPDTEITLMQSVEIFFLVLSRHTWVVAAYQKFSITYQFPVVKTCHFGKNRGQDGAKLDVDITVLSSQSLRMASYIVYHTDKSSVSDFQFYICSDFTQAVIISYHSVPPQSITER